ELLVTCLIRACFCEMIASKVGLPMRQLDAFLMGLFSAMDGLTDQPLDLVIADIPVAADVSAALLGASTPLGKIYRLILTFERGNVILAEMIARDLKLSLAETSEIYRQSLSWTDRGMIQSMAA